MKNNKLTYEKSGVNIKAADKFVKFISSINAKDKGNFDLADKIRAELFAQGILIEDQKGKTIWKLKWLKKKYIYLIPH